MDIQTKGIMACYAAERRDFDKLLYVSERGDKGAMLIRMGIGLWRQTAFAPKAPPACCCVCLSVFPDHDAPECFFLAIPLKGDGDSLVSGVCKACCREIGSDGLLGKMMEHFRKFWPDSKVRGGGLDNR